MRRRRRKRREGYLYVAVLFTSLIVAGSIATAISLDTTRIKMQNAAADRGSAIRLAESELHRTSVFLSTDASWRDDLSHAEVSDWIIYGAVMGADNAATRFTLTDSDGDLADDVFDDVEVVGHARFGVAEAAVSVVMENGFEPLDLLHYGVTTFDDLECENGATLVSEKPVQVFDDCKSTTSGMVVAPRLELDGRLEVTVRGDLATSNVQLPAFDVLQSYEQVGTEIGLETLPVYNGSRAIYSAVLSAGANPYGDTDPNGVYWIDAEGQQLTIADSRLHAVVSVRNASQILLTGALNWETPGDAGTILVTNSRIDLAAIAPTLDEAALAVNFNPPSTPYRGVDANVNMTDRFPTELRGVVYSSHHVRVFPTTNGDPVNITGAVICNDLRLNHHLQVRAYDEVLTNVPIGLSDPSRFRFKHGTFRRVPAPGG